MMHGQKNIKKIILLRKVSKVKCISVFRSVRKIAVPTINFVMSLSVRQSARMEQLCYSWKDLHERLYLSIFRKYFQNIHVSLKSARITDTLHEDQ